MSKHIAEKYVDDVLSGKIQSCNWVKLACERYVRDRETMLENGWKFDKKKAQKVINFFAKHLKHYQGIYAGKPFVLAPWQQFIMWNIFGFLKADGTRRFSDVNVFVPRKNGKTELVAGAGLFMMGPDGEAAPEVYSTATDKDQAKIAFLKAKEMVKNSELLLSYYEPLANAIYSEHYASTFKPWSSDSGRKDGYNPHFAIVDEYHAHKDDSMVEVIESGLGARTQPMVFKITTAGFNSNSVCKKMQEKCEMILKGEIIEDHTFCIIFTIDKDDDWKDPSVWIKANPSWDIMPTLRGFMEKNFTAALNDKSGEKSVNFKTKNLNIWTTAAKEWVKREHWDAMAADYTPESLQGKRCYGGLDLSDTGDISSFCLWFPDEKKFLWWYWAPEAKLDTDDGPMYRQWADNGWLTLTPGNVIDYDYIRRQISGYYVEDGAVKHDESCIADQFGLESTAFDPWNARQLCISLKETDGLEMNIFRQGFVTFSEPTKDFKKQVAGREFLHNNNPVTNWMIGNVVESRDAAGNIKPDKGKSKLKIDGVVAAIMAQGECTTQFEESSSCYVGFSVLGQ